jgi:glycosyltransferase involved in cell wall biosynthesis
MENNTNAAMRTLQDTAELPLLSILCITYNHEKYISQSLDSFLMQKTEFPFEIVIGEDCSTDGTISILKEYQQQHPDVIKIITSSFNVGVVNNFRRAMKQCNGKYIAICEGDDYWTDNQKIQKQVEFLEKNPEFVITYHDAHAFNASDSAETPQLPKEYQCDANEADLINARQISTLTACFRNILPEIPVEFNHAPILDLCLWSLLGDFGKGKYLKNIKPAAYRMHEGGILSSQSNENKTRMTMHTYLCLSRYYERIGNIKVSRSFTAKISLLANSQLNRVEKIRLIATEIDALLGSPLYYVKKFLMRK